MRTFLGFLIPILCIPPLSFLTIELYKEWNQYIPLQQYLDQQIKVDHIALPEMSYITAADDTIVSEITNGEKRVSLTYAEIPGILKDVFVISED